MVGVDIGSSSVKVVELGRAGEESRIKSLGCSPWPEESSGDPRTAAGITRDLLLRSGLKGRVVSLSLPGGEAQVRFLKFPRMPRDELRQAVFWEASKQLSLPPENMVLQYTVFEESGGAAGSENVVMAAILPSEVVSRWTTSFREAGVKIGAIDIGAMALLAYSDLREPWDKDGVTVMIDIGHTRTGIHVFNNQRLRFTRNITVGGQDFTRTLIDLFQIDYEEAEALKVRYGVGNDEDGEEALKVQQLLSQVLERIAVEVQRSLDYYRAQEGTASIAGLWVTGGTSLLPGLPGQLSHSLDMTVHPDQPWEVTPVAPDAVMGEQLLAMGPLFSTVIGLATRRENE